MAVMYTIFLEPEVHAIRQTLPGNMRQRIRRIIDEFAATPRPIASQLLDTTDLDLSEQIELRRVRVEQWRIVYAVNDVEQWVWVLGIYRRPPYNYANVPDLIRRVHES